LGFWDDWAKLRKRQNLGLTGRKKLLVQTVIILGIGLVLMYLRSRGMFSTEVWFPFLKWLHPDLGWGYLVFLWFVLAGASNAVNLTDGLDGLAVGSVLFASAALTGFAYVAGHRVFAGYLNILYVPQAAEVVIFGGALMGASIGFLWFNAHPAEVFMGDVGALSLGASLGILGVLIKQELVLGMVGGLFVIEALSVILQVASFRLRGRRIFRMAPLHHHFELLGWPESKVVVRFWILAFLFALLSLTTLKLR
jgi:phospho-N-acetylmuramoyl-pentapeptide-transferase